MMAAQSDAANGRASGQALSDLAADRAVIVTGAEGGAYVLIAARGVTPEVVTRMAGDARGLVGLVMSRHRARQLGLTLQPRRGDSTAPLYTQSIEAAEGTSTGISAADRARTIRVAAFGTAEDIVTPGHIFPQLAGDRERGQAAIALRLLAAAGADPVGAICTILDDRGEVADTACARRLALRLGLSVIDATEVNVIRGAQHFT